MHLFCGSLPTHTGSKGSHTGGDCFCVSWVTELLQNHASGHFSTTPYGKRQCIQECGRHSGIIKVADLSSSPSNMRYCDIVKRRLRYLVFPRKKERKTTRECDTCGTQGAQQLCADSVSDVRRARQRTLILSATASRRLQGASPD